MSHASKQLLHPVLAVVLALGLAVTAVGGTMAQERTNSTADVTIAVTPPSSSSGGSGGRGGRGGAGGSAVHRMATLWGRHTFCSAGGRISESCLRTRSGIRVFRTTSSGRNSSLSAASCCN